MPYVNMEKDESGKGVKGLGETRAPLASSDDFSSLYNYFTPDGAKKVSDFSTPMLHKSAGEKIELMENSENAQKRSKYNASRKLRPFVKVPEDRCVADFNSLRRVRVQINVDDD